MLPTNFSREVAALPALLAAARLQLTTEPARRASGPENKERVRNATALMAEISPVVDDSDGVAHQVMAHEAKPKVQGDLTPRLY